MIRLLLRRGLGSLGLCASLLLPTLASAQTNLVSNGRFGSPAYTHQGTSVSNPSTSGWTARSAIGGFIGTLNKPTTSVKFQSVYPGCNQFYCYGATAHNWFVVSSIARVKAETSSFTNTLKPSTRYKLSFHSFRDLTSIASSDATYTQPGSLRVKLSSTKGDYFVKNISVPSYTFGQYVPGVNKPIQVEFVTPVATTDSGSSNLTGLKLTFEWDSSNKKFDLAFSDVALEEIVPTSAETKIIVNTHGYPTTGSKVATLELPEGYATQGLRWRLRYGNGFATSTSSTSVSFIAVATDANGLPLKNASGAYTLQTTSDGSLRVVGGTGTGGQYSYFPSNNGSLDSMTPQLDKDTGKYVVNLDFSDYGPQVITKRAPITDGSVVPGTYTAQNGEQFYILTSSTTTTNFGTCCGANFYIDLVDSTNTTIATSNQFAISDKPFDSLKNNALYSFYHQRSGEEISPKWDPSSYSDLSQALGHKAGHAPDLASCWANETQKLDLHGNDWGSSTSSCTGFSKDVSGGWYDAADHGKYVVNGGVSLWTLQNLIERLQTKGTLTTAFPAGKFQLPPTTNDSGAALNISDLLAEARIEMQWMLKMQVPDNFKMKVPLGYQDKKLSAAPSTHGVYQIDLTGNQLPDTAAGAVDFAGGKLPRLRMKVKFSEVDVGGMVFHAVHDRNWTGLPLDPSKDTEARALMYPTTAATLNFSAVAAQCSRIWKGIDDAFANRCFNAAVKAWETAKKFRVGFTDNFGNVIPAKSDVFRYEYSNQSWNNTDPSLRNKAILEYGFAINPMFNGGGAYGDLRVGDEYYWAGSELYLATAARGNADTAYITYGKQQGVLAGADIYSQHSKCEQSVEPIQCYIWINGFDWQNTSALGTLSLLTYNSGTLATPNAKTNLLSFAEKLVTQANGQGYRFAKQPFSAGARDTHYEWGANGGLLNRMLILGMAVDFQADEGKRTKYLATIVNSMGYLLGRNTLETSFISGYGNNAMSNPHHRWFAKHADTAFPRIPAGYIAGGPNTRDIPALRANAPRYETQDAVNWAISNGDPEAKLGGIADSSQRFFDAEVVSKCMNESASGSLPTYTPQRCYADHYRSFATNEVAINWQAPLVWVSQFLSEKY